MTDKFKKMFDISMKFEKGNLVNGYVNDKDDAGGETVYGITRKNFPKLKVWASLDKLNGVVAKRGYKIPQDEMEEIMNVYYKNFYQRVNAEAFNDVCLGMQIFDFAINAGVSTAVKTLQRLMHITVDGVCGKQTVTTANVRHTKSVREDYRKARIAYYNGISTKGNNKKYLKGWIKRAETCDKVFL